MANRVSFVSFNFWTKSCNKIQTLISDDKKKCFDADNHVEAVPCITGQTVL